MYGFCVQLVLIPKQNICKENPVEMSQQDYKFYRKQLLYKCPSQSSKRMDRLALMSMENFLLDEAVNPSPAPLLPKSILRELARSNSPRSPCCSCCCASFPSAILLPPDAATAGWKSFLKPPINRRNFCCCLELSK